MVSALTLTFRGNYVKGAANFSAVAWTRTLPATCLATIQARGYSTGLIREGSAPRSKALLFCVPLLTEKVALSNILNIPFK